MITQMYEGFSPIPDYPDYIISREGVIIDTVLNYCLLQKYSPTLGYMWVYLERIQVTAHVHVLKAKTFIPGYRPGLHVNHKDGVKTNNPIDNLEWVTPSGNLVHAFKNDLRSDNIPMQLLDTKTKLITDYYSQNELARYLEVNPEKIWRYMHSVRNCLFMNRYVLLYAYENLEEIKSRITTETLNGAPKSVYVELIDSKRLLKFSSIASACNYLGISKYTAAKAIKNGTQISGCNLRYALEDEVAEIIDSWPKPVPPKRKPLRVRSRDRTTGETSEWESLDKFAIANNSSKSTVQKSVYLKGGWRNFEIEYLR